MSTPDIKPVNESRLIFTVGMIQFVNAMDFMMVMPLGPDFAADLGIPVHAIGMIAGVYAMAAAITGFIASFFLDNYARKKVLLFTLLGVSIATVGGAIAWDRNSMLLARILAGSFGGPLISTSLAMIADYIPPQKRATAMGKVMGGFSAATIFGVPFGLELSERISWHAPFIVTGIIGLMVFAYGFKALPYRAPFVNNVLFRHHLASMGQLLKRKTVLLTYFLVFLSMSAAFLIIPNISPHLQMNLDYPRDKLGILYLVGGVMTLFTMRLSGILVDRTSSGFVSVLSTILFVAVVLNGFVYYDHAVPAIYIFVGFMLSMTTRNICMQGLSSKIPPPELRGAYMSLQSSLTSLMQALAAYVSSAILVEQNGRLLHMDIVGWLAIGISLLIPVFFYYIESHLKRVY